MSGPEALPPPSRFGLAGGTGEWVTGGAVLAGGRAYALVTLAEDETRRRDELGTGAVTDLALLNVFLSLPLGHPISWGALTASERRLLRTSPEGSVLVESGKVTRVLDRPTRVHATAVRGGSWREGLRRAGRFVGVSSVVLVLPDRARISDSRLWEADVVGVGVWTSGPHGLTEVIPAPACRPGRFGAAFWRFEERAYQAWLEASRPVPPLPGALPWPSA